MTENFVAALRELADLYESHPELPIPAASTLWLNVFLWDQDPNVAKPKLAAIARAVAPARKNSSDDWFSIRKDIGGSWDDVKGAIRVDFNAVRKAVCTPRVVSIEHVPEKVIPEQVIPARDVEVLEWDCPKLLEDDVVEVS
jgi:hypothetical protein